MELSTPLETLTFGIHTRSNCTLCNRKRTQLYTPDFNQPHVYTRACSGTSLLSEAIKLDEDGPNATHVEFWDPKTNPFIGARSKGGVQERPADYCKVNWDRRYATPCTQEQADGVLADARAHIGQKYDYKAILGIFLRNNLHSDGKEICSEFWTSVMQGRKFDVLNVDPQFVFKITPEMVHISPIFLRKCFYKVG
jgi:hypothetical protein